MSTIEYQATERGSISILALLTMLLLLSIGGALFTISITEVQTSSRYSDGLAAQYAAEAGARRAMVELNRTNGSWPGASNQIVGSDNTYGGRYTITVEQKDIHRVITAIGTYNGASRQVVLSISPQTPPTWITDDIKVDYWNNQ